MLNRMLSLIVALIIASPSSAVHRAQAQDKAKPAEKDQTVRLKTDLFEVRAVVSDKKGRLIDDLKAEDFEVLENGRPQRIEFFSKEIIPQRSARPSAPAVSTTPNPDRTSQLPGRTVVLFVDTLHLSTTSFMRMKLMLRKFIQEQLTDNDLAAIVTSGGQMGLFNQFTRDRRILLYAVDKLAIGGQAISRSKFTPYIAAAVDRSDRSAISAAIEIILAEDNMQFTSRQMAESYVQVRARMILAEAANWRKAALLTLIDAVKRMAELPGQRIVALLTDGFSLSGDGGSYDTNELNRAINRAATSGVVIYSILAKGLEPDAMYDASSSISMSPNLSRYLSDSERDAQQGMNALAADTGGEAFFNSNDIGGKLKEVLDNNAIYYTLAFYPATDDKDKGKPRKLTVRVKNHPDYEVRAQKRFLASDLKNEKQTAGRTPQQRLVDAISSSLPITTVGVALSADYLEADTDESQATIQVHIDAATLEYVKENEKHAFNVELVIFVVDSSGKVAKTVSNEVKGSFTAERLETAKRNGMKYTTRVQLKPGVYQARVGVREIGTERVGTAMSLLEVPDLKKNKMAMSGLFFSEAKAIGQQQSKKEEAWEFYDTKMSRGIPVFKMNGNLVCSFMAYNTARTEAGREVQMQVALIHEGRIIYEGKWNPINTNMVVQGKKGMLVATQINLAMKPGLYEFQVKLQDPKSKKGVQQSALFEVVS